MRIGENARIFFSEREKSVPAMRVTTLVNKLIGLQGLWVRGFHFQADKARVVVDVVPRRRKPLCGICGRKVRKNKDRYNRYWRHLDLFGVRTYLRYSIRRVVCRRCGVVREKVPWYVSTTLRHSRAAFSEPRLASGGSWRRCGPHLHRSRSRFVEQKKGVPQVWTPPREWLVRHSGASFSPSAG